MRFKKVHRTGLTGPYRDIDLSNLQVCKFNASTWKNMHAYFHSSCHLLGKRKKLIKAYACIHTDTCSYDARILVVYKPVAFPVLLPNSITIA